MAREFSNENRYFVTLVDDSGTVIPLESLTRDEFVDFEAAHADDDLEYSFTIS